MVKFTSILACCSKIYIKLIVLWFLREAIVAFDSQIEGLCTICSPCLCTCSLGSLGGRA